MNRAWAWVIVVIALVAVWVDIPKHQFPFPFDCPGICYRLGGQSTFIEIKTHLGLDLQGGTQLILQLHPEQIPGGDPADEARHVDARGACARARRVVAVEAAVRLDLDVQP